MTEGRDPNDSQSAISGRASAGSAARSSTTMGSPRSRRIPGPGVGGGVERGQRVPLAREPGRRPLVDLADAAEIRAEETQPAAVHAGELAEGVEDADEVLGRVVGIERDQAGRDRGDDGLEREPVAQRLLGPGALPAGPFRLAPVADEDHAAQDLAPGIPDGRGHDVHRPGGPVGPQDLVVPRGQLAAVLARGHFPRARPVLRNEQVDDGRTEQLGLALPSEDAQRGGVDAADRHVVSATTTPSGACSSARRNRSGPPARRPRPFPVARVVVLIRKCAPRPVRHSRTLRPSAPAVNGFRYARLNVSRSSADEV